jgi:hypothetical protein
MAMSPVQQFGNFVESPPNQAGSLNLNFSPSPSPIQKRWKNNRLSANFVADYLTNFIPIGDDPTAQKRKEEGRSAVSYIANELLENALKFHDSNATEYIRFSIYLLLETDVSVILYTTNTIAESSKVRFQAFIQELLTRDPDQLYIEQIEKTAADINNQASGLGFLTMMNDYGARLGWKFEQISSNAPKFAVTTMVHLPI